MIKKYIDNIELDGRAKVRVKEMGNVTELFYQDRCNNKCVVKKISADQYIDMRTGETKDFIKTENRSQSLNGVRVSLGKLRDYINTNVSEPKRCKWVTLTYAENMTDTERLYDDFRKYNQRLKRKIKSLYGMTYEYICCYEPQGRGSWHMHVVYIFDRIAPKIDNDVIWKAWSPLGYKQKSIDGKGYDYTKIKRVDDVDNVGAYLTAYLGDIELDDVQDSSTIYSNEITIKVVNGEEKRIVKGGRLYLYPKGFNLYSCSKGIQKPKIYFETEKYINEKKVNLGTLTYEKTIKLSTEDNTYENVLNYRYYNKLR